jgi:hypothetical protein
MTAKLAGLVSNLDNDYLRRKLEEYSETVKGHHCPSVVSVKAVLKEIGIRQRQRKGFDFPTANESLEQFSKATALSKSTVSDSLRFCEWLGLCETVRKGGGPNKVPTVRRLVEEGFPVQNTNNQIGEIVRHNGEESDHNGAFPQTPRVLPKDSMSEFDTCRSKLNRDSASDASEQIYISIEDDLAEKKFYEEFNASDAIVNEELSKLAESIPDIVDLDNAVDLSLLLADLVDGLSGFDWDV